MSDTSYAPGEANALVTRHGAVLVAADLPAALLTRMWRRLDEGRGLAAVLEALTGAFGTSLTAIPAFAVALREGTALRLAARGALEIAVDAPGGGETVSGAGVTTWSERLVTGATAATLRVAGAAVAAELPIRDGVVRASVVTLGGAVPSAPAPPHPATPASALTAPAAEPPAAGVVDSTSVPISAETLPPQDSTLGGAPAREGADAPPAEGYDHLWGATVVRAVEDAAVRTDEDAAAEPSTPVPPLGDHDGETISVAQARALRAGDALVDSAPAPLAPQRPPAIGRLRVSNGQLVVLDRTVVIGRRPRSTRVTGTDLPHLVAVDSPQQDISRSHVEIRAEGDSILATDLHTTNGTTLRRSGADPVRLHPGERTVVVPGDVIDLGDGVTVTVEELP
ncbi:MAG: FHA domain-containing protein [Microbacterium sp.]